MRNPVIFLDQLGSAWDVARSRLERLLGGKFFQVAPLACVLSFGLCPASKGQVSVSSPSSERIADPQLATTLMVSVLDQTGNPVTSARQERDCLERWPDIPFVICALARPRPMEGEQSQSLKRLSSWAFRKHPYLQAHSQTSGQFSFAVRSGQDVWLALQDPGAAPEFERVEIPLGAKLVEKTLTIGPTEVAKGPFPVRPGMGRVGILGLDREGSFLFTDSRVRFAHSSARGQAPFGAQRVHLLGVARGPLPLVRGRCGVGE